MPVAAWRKLRHSFSLNLAAGVAGKAQLSVAELHPNANGKTMWAKSPRNYSWRKVGRGCKKGGNAAASWPRCQLLAHWKALGKMENCARRKSAYKCMYLGPPAGWCWCKICYGFCGAKETLDFRFRWSCPCTLANAKCYANAGIFSIFKAKYNGKQINK